MLLHSEERTKFLDPIEESSRLFNIQRFSKAKIDVVLNNE